MRDLVYGFYARRIAASLDPEQIPRHVGVILDGNRRWAKASGAPKSRGWRAGADKVEEVLGWCDEVGVEVVTLWLLSTDNLNRPASELTPLLAIIEGLVDDIANAGRWRVHPVGALDLLPADTARALKDAATRTADVPGLHVNVAVGYGGRREIADAVRALLHEQAAKGTTIEDLAKAPKLTTAWEGVRNYQARNFLRDEIKKGDGVLFYHSSCDPQVIVGTAVVVREGYEGRIA